MRQQSKLALLSEVRDDIVSLQKIISETQAELDELRRVESYLSKHTSTTDDEKSQTNQDDAGDDLPPPSRPSPTSERFKVISSLGDAAIIILRESGRPMRSAEIANILIDGGFPVGDRDERDFSNTIFSALHRRTDLFEKVGRGLWTLRQQKEEANGTIGH